MPLVAWAIEKLVERGWKSWQAKALLIGALVAIAIGAIVLAFTLFAHHFESVGGAKVEKKVAKAQVVAVAEARGDERKIAAGGTAIGAAVGRSTQSTTGLVTIKKTEIHDALNPTPRPGGGAAPDPVDTQRVSASLDALVEHANRSADSADARP